MRETTEKLIRREVETVGELINLLNSYDPKVKLTTHDDSSYGPPGIVETRDSETGEVVEVCVGFTVTPPERTAAADQTQSPPLAGSLAKIRSE